MAQQPAKSPEIERLIRIGDASRARLSDEVALLRQRFDVPARLRASMRGHPGGWLGGSLAAGLGVSLLLRRKPAAKKRKGWLGWGLSLGVAALRPAVKAWLANRLKQQFAPHSSVVFRPPSIPASQTRQDSL